MEELFLQLKTLFIDNVVNFFAGLDWFYIVALVLAVNASNKFLPLDKELSIGKWSVRLSASYRVLILGLVLAVVYYYLNEGESRKDVKILFESMLAAMALHAWIFQHIIDFVKKKWTSNLES